MPTSLWPLAAWLAGWLGLVAARVGIAYASSLARDDPRAVFFLACLLFQAAKARLRLPIPSSRPSRLARFSALFLLWMFSFLM